MSLAELKRRAQGLTRKQRSELRVWLARLDEQERLFAKLARARAGRVVDEDLLRRSMGPRPAG